MKNKKWVLLIPTIALGCVILFARARIAPSVADSSPEQSSSDLSTSEQPSKSPPPLNMSIQQYENANPTDYSELEPGTEIHDDFWHGTVTIVGKRDEVYYTPEEWAKLADGRLVTAQDGQYIMVEKDKDYVPPTSPTPEEIMQCDDDDRIDWPPVPEEDTAFYQSPSVEVDTRDISTRYGLDNFFPMNTIAGLRFVAKQFLTDIGLEDVTKLTGDYRTTQFAYSPCGFKCSMDAHDGQIGIYFDFSSGEWKFSYSGLNDGESYVSYNPVEFVAPSKRDAVRKELNDLIGYAKY